MRPGALAIIPVIFMSTPASAEECELHVFPADNVVLNTKVWNDGLIGAMLEGSAPPQQVILRDLPPPIQFSAAKSAILASPQFAGWTVKEQSRVVDYKTATKDKSRLSGSQTGCYAEFAITTIGYTSHALMSKRIGTMPVLREFGRPGEKIRITKMGGASKLTLYPNKNEATGPAAREEVAAAFADALRLSITKFLKRNVSLTNVAQR